MTAIIIAILIPVASIALIIIVKRRRNKEVKVNPLKPETHVPIPLWKGLVYQLAPVIGFLMILFYFVLKNEGVIKLSGVVGWIYFALALYFFSLYKKVEFPFVKSDTSFIGYKVIALTEIKSKKSKHRSFQLFRSGKENKD